MKGVYTREELKRFDSKIFKVGRTTGISAGKYVPFDSAIAIDLKDGIIKYAKEKEMELMGFEDIEKKEPTQELNQIDHHQDIFIGYLKASICETIRKRRQQCYPIKWFDRQMMFQFRPEGFKHGDSGTSVVDEKGDDSWSPSCRMDNCHLCFSLFFYS